MTGILKRPQPACPECDKLLKVSTDSNIIGEFLDMFLSSKGLHLARYIPVDGVIQDEDDNDIHITEVLIPATEYRGDAGISRLLAEYFGIDLDKVEQERKALLEWMREMNDEQE